MKAGKRNLTGANRGNGGRKENLCSLLSKSRRDGDADSSAVPFEPSAVAHRLPVGTGGWRVDTHRLPAGTHARPVGAHEPFVGPNPDCVGTNERPVGTNARLVGAHGLPVNAIQTPV